jgi:hypothetical protein
MATRDFVGIVTKRGNIARGPLVSYKVIFNDKRIRAEFTMTDKSVTLLDFMEQLRLNNRKAKRNFSYTLSEDGSKAYWQLSYAGHTQNGYAGEY